MRPEAARLIRHTSRPPWRIACAARPSIGKGNGDIRRNRGDRGIQCRAARGDCHAVAGRHWERVGHGHHLRPRLDSGAGVVEGLSSIIPCLLIYELAHIVAHVDARQMTTVT